MYANPNPVTPTSCITPATLLANPNVTPVSISGPVRVADDVTVDGPQPIAGMLVFNNPQHGLLLTPYLAGADNCQCNIDVRSWRRVLLRGEPSKPTKNHWTSILVARLLCTASTAVGNDAGYIPSTLRACDLIFPSVDRTPSGVKVYQKAGGGDDEPAAALIDCMGGEFLSLHFNTNGLGSAATGANVTIAGLNNG